MSFAPPTRSLMATGDQTPLSSTEPAVWYGLVLPRRYTPSSPFNERRSQHKARRLSTQVAETDQ